MADFELDSAGIMELCKGAAMQSVLKEAADKVCAGATADAAGIHMKGIRNPPFMSGVKVLDRTAIGMCWISSPVGWKAQNERKSLTKQCH